MPEEKKESLNFTECLLTGAGVGAAGLGSSAGFIGLATTIACAPFAIGIGVVGGVAWWTLRAIARAIND
jgi:hypothetical protein